MLSSLACMNREEKRGHFMLNSLVNITREREREREKGGICCYVPWTV